MNFGIQKRRGTQLRAGWSNFHAVSSHLRSIYAKSVDLLKGPILCLSLSHPFKASSHHRRSGPLISGSDRTEGPRPEVLSYILIYDVGSRNE